MSPDAAVARRLSAAALLFLGCGSATVEDHRESDAWSVDAEPRVRVGWIADEPDTEFFDVVGVGLLPDGAIAIGDRGLGRVTVFEADGSSVRFAVGGSGEGPGEFGSLAHLVVDGGGHLHAFDSRLQRLTEWSEMGVLVGTTELTGTPSGRPLGTVDRFASGEWYGRETSRMRTTRDGGMARDTVGFFSVREDGEVGPAITAAPGAIGTVVRIGGRGATRDAMYSPRPLDARLGDCLLVMAGDESRLRVFGSDGALRGLIELPFPARATSAADRQAWIDGMIAANDRSPRAAELLETMGRELEMAERFPIASRILADPAGYVWLERYEPPEGPSGYWIVVDGTGEVVAEPILPDGVRLVKIEGDQLIGIESDELDRQRVHVYGLRRGPGAGATMLAECTA